MVGVVGVVVVAVVAAVAAACLKNETFERVWMDQHQHLVRMCDIVPVK